MQESHVKKCRSHRTFVFITKAVKYSNILQVVSNLVFIFLILSLYFTVTPLNEWIFVFVLFETREKHLHAMATCYHPITAITSCVFPCTEEYCYLYAH